MAINTIKATMQMRIGMEDDFDPSQMTAGEWGVSKDTKYVRMCFMPGLCLRMATYEAFEEDMKRIQQILSECRDIKAAVEEFIRLAEQHKTQAEHYSLISKSWAVGGTGLRTGEDTNNSEHHSRQSESYAHGGTGLRIGEDVDNSEYYSRLAAELVEEAKRIVAAATQGALIPAGTIPYEKLPSEPMIGFMYNISNDFITDDRFEEGAGTFYSAGNNVYWTSQGKWDVLTGIQSYDFVGTQAELDEKIAAGEVTEGMRTFVTDGGESGGDDNTGDLEERIELLESKTEINTFDNAGIVAKAHKPYKPGLYEGYPLELAYTWQQVPSLGAAPSWYPDWRHEGSYFANNKISKGLIIDPLIPKVDPLNFEAIFEYIDIDAYPKKSTIHSTVYDATNIYRNMNYFGAYGRKAGYDPNGVHDSRKISENFSLYYEDTYNKIGDFVVVFHFATNEDYNIFAVIDEIKSSTTLTDRKYLYMVMHGTGTSIFTG